nr:response regulator [uncultured Marinifilum sp.]
MKVLFVDDDINLGNFISNVLETDYNYSVHFQNTILGIIHIIEDFAPDIVILDVEIGEKNGIDTGKNIIANYPQIPILFVSSHTEEEMITRGIDVGGNAYIPTHFYTNSDLLYQTFYYSKAI